MKPKRMKNPKFSVTAFFYRVDNPSATRYRSSTMTFSCPDPATAIQRAQRYMNDDNSSKINSRETYVWNIEYAVHRVYSASDVRACRERVRKYEKKNK